ncbi:hypothetical protein PCS_01415 [Desulfocurvibacter africanus PCS]|uniref:Peptidase C-terminal archaeal/bacterial domain-containing protein n=1 Tax=Desulfocurvibacter africanus PCS TaxID=1262666 RepID=M5PUT3_DESAF|nr:hypothetical protein [Desulfocurvibacter africanus]EMG37765.1 hypothetical protein PCS_01415 [Desulfocurvibacter africanus PCS]
MPGLRLVSGSNAGICFLAVLLYCILAFTGCTDNEPDDTTDLVSENEPNDTLVQATGIPVGVTVIGAVDQGEDFADFFIFSVFVSGSYTMTLSGFGANDLDLLLYDRNGLLLARADSDGASREIVRFLDVDVQYVIEVRAVDAPSTTAYTLRIDE